MALLEISDLTIAFGAAAKPAVSGVSLSIAEHETVAIVGESGSGKSTTGLALMGLLSPSARVLSGTIRFSGRSVLDQTPREWSRFRGGDVGYVPQDPMTNLNPVRKVGSQVSEGLIIHGECTRAEARRRTLDLLSDAGLKDPERVAGSYPHQLSGGMRQRVLIAMALACKPALLLADEPTSALDVTVQRRILNRLAMQSRATGASMLLITHDLAMAAERADRIIVMSDGMIVEQGPAEKVFTAPKEAYTRRLLQAAPTLETAPLVGEPSANDAVPLLRTKALSKEFAGSGRRKPSHIAVNEATVSVRAGTTLGIVGESGSGKTTLSRLILGLEQATSGSIEFVGREVVAMHGKELRQYRRQVQPVFQDPYSSLDGAYTIGSTIAEPMMLAGMSRQDREDRVAELLEQVALPADFASRRPEQLSGGQRQRVAIARALAANPSVVVCDEAVSALDVVVQHQILQLLVSLQEQLGVTYIFISHDLAVVKLIAHQVAVMQAGRIVEAGSTESVFANPQADYTRELLAAIPGPHHNVGTA